MMIATDWKRRVTVLDAKLPDGQPLVVPWMVGSDDVVALDLTKQLEVGEAVTNPVVTVTRLYAVGETADTDVTEAVLNGERQVAGNIVLQRVHELEGGYYYRVQVLHGEDGNRRGASLLIHCVQ